MYQYKYINKNEKPGGRPVLRR